MLDIPSYESRYAITRDGKVWSHPKHNRFGKNGRHQKTDGKWLKQSLTKSGYYRVYLWGSNGKRKALLVSRLVALTYIPNEKNLPMVNHINANPKDNRVENLEWCTAQGNAKHAYYNGLTVMPNQSGAKNSQAKLNWDSVKKIRSLAGIKTRKELSEDYNVSVRAISDILNNKTWSN